MPEKLHFLLVEKRLKDKEKQESLHLERACNNDQKTWGQTNESDILQIQHILQFSFCRTSRFSKLPAWYLND